MKTIHVHNSVCLVSYTVNPIILRERTIVLVFWLFYFIPV